MHMNPTTTIFAFFNFLLLAAMVVGVIALGIWLSRRNSGGHKCQACGRRIPADGQICPYCGEKLQQGGREA